MERRSRQNTPQEVLPSKDQAAQPPSTNVASSPSTQQNLVYVVAEEWHPEDVSAAKGEGYQVVKVLGTLEAANAFAKKYEEHCMASIKEYKYPKRDPWSDERVNEDGTLHIEIHWADLTFIDVTAWVVEDNAEDAEMPYMVMDSTYYC